MPTIADRIDPELREASRQLLASYPGGPNEITDLVQRRAITGAVIATAQMDAPILRRVTWEDRLILGDPDHTPVKVRVYRSRDKAPEVGIVFLHSGGMILGDLEFEHVQAATLAELTDALVVSVDYRLAPEHPYPAALEDCMTAIRWMVDTAADLGIDATRYVTYGHSAGGGLAIASALRARDSGEALPSLVMAAYPMIDDRPTPSNTEIDGIGVWDNRHNREGWRCYLGDQDADEYAAPARAADLSGMPPTFIDVGELDVFRDENTLFALRLAQAGVPVEFHLYPGAFHGSEGLVPEARVSLRTVAARLEALRTVLHGSHHQVCPESAPSAP